MVFRHMEDFVTWVDTSKLKRTIMKYNDEVRICLNLSNLYQQTVPYDELFIYSLTISISYDTGREENGLFYSCYCFELARNGQSVSESSIPISDGLRLFIKLGATEESVSKMRIS